MKIEWPPMKHLEYDGLAADIYARYLAVFREQYNLSPSLADLVAHHGEELCDAEYKAMGDKHYTDSLLICVRNAMYSAGRAEERWTRLRTMNLRPPILDYGCGVGFTCLWLEKSGLGPVYGHELSGLQMRIAGLAGVKPWTGQHVETVLCLNVLEHVPDPLAMLKDMRTLAPRVIANVCISDKHTHVAPVEELRECRLLLMEEECLYDG